MEQDLNALTQHWYDRTRMVEKAHFTRCALFRQRHVKLGCITIICTTLLGVLSNLAPDHGTISLDFVGRNMSFDGASGAPGEASAIQPVKVRPR